MNRTAIIARILIFFTVGFTLAGFLLLFVYTRGRAAPQIVSLKSGNWSDPTVWSSGAVPPATMTVGISTGHNVTYDLTNSIINGLSILPGATLTFKSDKTVSLESTKNVVVEGNLVMKPSSSSINHTLRFIGINESAFVGGGMVVLESDVGLWVMGDGVLDIQGKSKKTWLNASGSLSVGATSTTVDKEPTGWEVGDEIVIVPTKFFSQNPPPGTNTGFEERILSSVNISGKSISWNSGLTEEHSSVTFEGKTNTAEIMNLTRNVHIEGQSTGRAHIFIHSNKPQTVVGASLRYLGPFVNGDGGSGRYSLHFHHSLDSSRGSLIDSVIVRDGTNNGFVPHHSHGITMRNSGVYHNLGEGFWWDLIDADCTDPSTNDTLWDENIVAWAWRTGDNDTFNRMSGFSLGRGDRNMLINSVAVGIQGGVDSSGIKWPPQPTCPRDHPDFIRLEHNGIWNFQDNLSHNNSNNGIFVWQNAKAAHFVEKFRAYHNGKSGIEHGAYGNTYRYDAMQLYKNGGAAKGENRSASVINHTASDIDDVKTFSGQRLTFSNMVLDGAGVAEYGLIIAGHAQGSNIEGQFRNLDIKGYKQAAIMIDEGCQGEAREDFVYVTAEGRDLELSDFYVNPANKNSCTRGINENSIIRVQRRDNTAYKLTSNADGTGLISTPISAFAIPIPDPIVVPPPDTGGPRPTAQPTQPQPTQGLTSIPSPSPTRGITQQPTQQPTQGLTQAPTGGITPTAGGSPTPGQSEDFRINLILSFQGIVGKPQTDKMQVNITLAGPGVQNQEKTAEFIVAETGKWTGNITFSGIDQASNYAILVKGEKHVQKKVCDVEPSETSPGTYRCSLGKIALQPGTVNLDFSRIKLLVGDIPDQDGIIDAYDISFIRNNIGKSDPNILAIGDLNLDGRVDTQDYSLLIASLSVKYDEE